MSQEQHRNALVLGAGGGLGQAIVAQLLTDTSIDRVIAVSRNAQTEDLSSHWMSSNRLTWITSEYTEPAMSEIVAQLMPLAGTLSRVCICHGLLHNDSIWPEKRLEDISGDALHEIFHANTVIPSLWFKLLYRLLAGKQRCVVATLSARVGSIGDNRVGGWYAYRASKSALNMMLKTIAVEYARRAKNVKLISFHPGTTDTALSKPFQASVHKDSLFSTVFVAERLTGIMDRAEVDGQLSYVDWDGKTIPW